MKFVSCKLNSETKCFAISNDVSGAWSRAPFLRILKANETKTPRKLSEKKKRKKGNSQVGDVQEDQKKPDKPWTFPSIQSGSLG